MRRGDMIVGERYILDGRGGNAIFLGVHEGRLTLEDGSVFDGAKGSLKFKVEVEEGFRTFFVADGNEVIEPATTREIREAQQAERMQHHAEVMSKALRIVRSLGFEPYDPNMTYGERMNFDFGFRRYEDDIDDLDIEGFKMRHLLAILRKFEPQNELAAGSD